MLGAEERTFRTKPRSPYRPALTVRPQIVDALITRMEPVGTEDLRGVPTWHYRLTLDREQAMEIR